MSWATRRMRRGRSRRSAGGSEFTSLESVSLQERSDRLGDLLVAGLAEHQAEVRMGAKRLVLCLEPLGDVLCARLGHVPIEAGPDDEPRDVEEALALDDDAPQDRTLGGPGLKRLLSEQVLDPEDV